MGNTLPTREFQDLGDATKTIRPARYVGGSGVLKLTPDEGKSHLEAMAAIRDVVDEYYGDSLDRVVDSDDDEIIIQRLVTPSDNLPYIEYQIVTEGSFGEE